MIRIVTDSTSDITIRQARRRGIELVLLNIQFGDAHYDQLADETFAVFYEMMRTSKNVPTTSQAAPGDFLSIFQAARAAGDDVVVITLSSKISGTYQSALLAKDMAGYDRVYVIDSLSTIIGQRLLVDLAVSLRDMNASTPDIVSALQDAVTRLVLMAGLDTLKYLRKGGRIPKTTEVIGTMIGVKPLAALVDGSIAMVGKARGRMGAFNKLLQLVEEKSDFDPTVPVYFGYTSDDAQCSEFRKLAEKRFALTNTVQYPIGSVVGTHVGPGAFVISYLQRAQA